MRGIFLFIVEIDTHLLTQKVGNTFLIPQKKERVSCL